MVLSERESDIAFDAVKYASDRGKYGPKNDPERALIRALFDHVLREKVTQEEKQIVVKMLAKLSNARYGRRNA